MSHLAKQYVPPDSHSTEALSWQQSHFLRLFIYLLFKTSSWSVDKTLPVGEIDSQTALVPWPFSRSDGSMTISISGVFVVKISCISSVPPHALLIPR